jgi:hypothetical protein
MMNIFSLRTKRPVRGAIGAEQGRPLMLGNGSRVGVIIDGPAESFFSYFLDIGLKIALDLYEARSATVRARGEVLALNKETFFRLQQISHRIRELSAERVKVA